MSTGTSTRLRFQQVMQATAVGAKVARLVSLAPKEQRSLCTPRRLADLRLVDALHHQDHKREPLGGGVFDGEAISSHRCSLAGP